jgi:hypothetical protein
MEYDTRGLKKKYKDNAKRHNVREEVERQYRIQARQAQKVTEEVHYEVDDDSKKFLDKMKKEEEKKLKALEKARIYEEEMNKCMPKAK